jgi:hypothetical protein
MSRRPVIANAGGVSEQKMVGGVSRNVDMDMGRELTESLEPVTEPLLSESLGLDPDGGELVGG